MAVNLAKWKEPTELDAPDFNMQKNKQPEETAEAPKLKENKPAKENRNDETAKPYDEPQSRSDYSSGMSNMSGLLSSILSNFQNGNGGGNLNGLDIGTILGMLNSSGKDNSDNSKGSGNSMFKMLLPLLLNGGVLGNLFSGNKKTTASASAVESNTINLDNYRRVK